LYNLVSFSGILILLGFAWMCSGKKKAFPWRVVLWGTGLQMVFACFIFLVPAGSSIFLFLNEVVVKILKSANAGSQFVFGRLAVPPGETSVTGETSLGYNLAIQGLSTIVFFASIMAILYYFKIMPFLIRLFARVFTKLMRVSGAESLCTASSIFVGAESSLTIKPFLEKMTFSELHTVLTACMATVASNVLALYVLSLKEIFPTIAGHLISASILSAPAALIMSKILLPETGEPETLGIDVRVEYKRENNVIEAVVNGAGSGVKLIVGICALLLAFIGLVSLTDMIFGGVGGWINHLLGIQFDWSLKGLLGLLFYPFTLVIGIPLSDAPELAKIIGERVVVTEVTAYQDLALIMEQGVLKHPRSAVICTYALCGFAHVASLAIFVGGISALVPNRTKDLAKLGPRALLAATLACLMTAAIAGAFYNQGSVLLGD